MRLSFPLRAYHAAAARDLPRVLKDDVLPKNINIKMRGREGD